MSQFYIGGSTSQSPTSTPDPVYSPPDFDSDDDEDDTLPYPTELPRSDFLAPDFDPQTYLSSLRNRHQTLEDLRSDLRQRSQLLNKELLDLVNGNYEEFLSLGGDLKGGGEKVEGVRVGLLSFQREVEGIRKGVVERESEVRDLVEERKRVRRDVVVGRALLEVNEMVAELEERLGVRANSADGVLDPAVELDDLELDDADGNVVQIRRLQRNAQQYLLMCRLVARIGREHPFLLAQRGRIEELRRTRLLDLASALRQAKEAKEPEAILGVLNLYGELGTDEEATRVMREG